MGGVKDGRKGHLALFICFNSVFFLREKQTDNAESKNTLKKTT